MDEQKNAVTAMEEERHRRGMTVAEFYAVPRNPPSNSKLPIFDATHVRNAMARFNQTQGLSAEERATAKRKIIAAAHKFNIDATEFEKQKYMNFEISNIITCIKEIKAVDPDGTVVFYANAFNNIDTDNDVSLPGSFSKTIKENSSRIRHLKFHDTTKMCGVVKDLSEDETGLLCKSQLILGTQLGKETYEEYKAMAGAGKKMEHSCRVNAVKYSIEPSPEDEDEEIRKISEWKLWEVSTLNAWGANPNALQVAVKEFKDATKEDLVAEIQFLKGLLNISSYNNIKLELIERQINYLDSLKAALQPSDITESRTFNIGELKIINEILKQK